MLTAECIRKLGEHLVTLKSIIYKLDNNFQDEYPDDVSEQFSYKYSASDINKIPLKTMHYLLKSITDLLEIGYSWTEIIGQDNPNEIKVIIKIGLREPKFAIFVLF